MATTLNPPHTIQLSTWKDLIVPAFPEEESPSVIIAKWLASFAGVLSGADPTVLDNVIHPNAWWRDQLCVTWDFRTLEGVSKISEFLQPRLNAVGFRNFTVQETGKFRPHEESPIEGLRWIKSMFSFETNFGYGKGMVRLVATSAGEYKAHMLYTALQELKSHSEAAGDLRPLGGTNSLEGGVIKGNWLERRDRQKEFLDSEPTVVIIGAGQSGLNVAARLETMGIPCLLVDKNKRVGDNWRQRYRTLVTHDPVQYTHMAYMPFPANWPMFTPKDKLGDWFEYYAGAMELNIWLNTTIKSAEYSEDTKIWSVEVTRGDGTTRKLKPKHVLFCTGHAGEPQVPTFPHQDKFQGMIYHGSEHKDASLSGEAKGKKVVVVGTGNSGHDIAQNYFENGADVSMLQRRGTYVISAKKGLFMLHKGLYDEHGPPTADADIYGQSLPIPVQFALNVRQANEIKEAEKETLDGLEKAGFKLDFGSDGSGIYRKYITRGGGYYVDVGASQLIVDGKIKMVYSPHGIQGFESDGLILADGRKLQADIVVLATGYDNMRTSLRKVLGDKIADKAKDVWDLDDEGEVNAMWRPSGHPRLWFMGGSLALCRIYSRFLALQIAATEAGLIEEK